MAESYAVIGELPGYRFGDDGSVESRWVRGSKRHRMREEWRPVKLRANSRHRYLYVTLRTPVGRKHFRVNILILWAFTGVHPPGMDAAHEDGDLTNNQVDNLRWKTRVQNIADMRRHGTHREGRQIPTAVLSEDSVICIVALFGIFSYAEIGRQFQVSEATIRKIKRGETWKHVTGGVIGNQAR